MFRRVTPDGSFAAKPGVCTHAGSAFGSSLQMLELPLEHESPPAHCTSSRTNVTYRPPELGGNPPHFDHRLDHTRLLFTWRALFAADVNCICIAQASFRCLIRIVDTDPYIQVCFSEATNLRNLMYTIEVDQTSGIMHN